MFRNDLEPRSSPKYMCIKCDYGTGKHSNYMKHLSTRKHMEETARKSEEIARKSDESEEIDMFPYKCVNCIKQYKNRDGLWKHNKKCIEPVENVNTLKDGHIDTSNKLIYDLLKEICSSNEETNKHNIELQKQNAEFQNKLLEFMKDTTNHFVSNNVTNNNTMNNCNNTNTQVNINMFLNEQCKDAITLNAFIQSISPTFDEVLYMANNGNKEGLYKILKKSFSQIELTKRPMHCTDLKRHTTYVKDETGWLKEHDQTHLRKLCGKVEHACLVKTLAIIEGDERYTTNGTEEYEDSIRMMQESVGGRKGPVYNHGLILKSLEEQIALDQEKMKNTIKN